MAHCGFEGTAVDEAFARPLKALKTALRGPRVSGPMAPDPPVLYSERDRARVISVPLSALNGPRAKADTAAGLQ